MELALITLIATSPGITAGLALGAVAWRTHRIGGAIAGALAGLVLTTALLWICFGSPIAQADGFAGAALLTLSICWPGLVSAAALAAWWFRNRPIVAGLCAAPVGAVAWLGGWAALN